MGRLKYRDRDFETGSFVEMAKQIDGQTDSETHTQTDRQRDGAMERKTKSEGEIRMDKWTNTEKQGCFSSRN